MTTPTEASTKRALPPEAVQPDETSNAPVPKAPRRVMPTPMGPVSTSTPQAAGAGGGPGAGAGPSDASDPTKLGSDDEDRDMDAEHLARLRALSEAEQQELIDRYFEAKEAHDDVVRLHESGDETRLLGEPHPALSSDRLQTERSLLEELRAARAAEGLPTEGEDFANGAPAATPSRARALSRRC